MNKRTYFLITLLGGWFGLHKFIQKETKTGFLYLFTLGLFGFGWIVDSIIAFAGIFSKTSMSKSTNVPYSNSLYAEQNQSLAYNSAARNTSAKYFNGLEEIESMWSVMYNLKIVHGEKANLFEEKCKSNIQDLYAMLEINKKCGYDSSVPPHVPAYVRLAMLFEKQERYLDAINICVDAIKAGAINDGNKGKMYGRLARLIRKSGITVSDEVLALSQKN